LCIKIPERINSKKVHDLAVGPSMAMLIDAETLQASVIGINARGELGLGDNEQRKIFTVICELSEKRIKQASVGKSGFMIAISDTIVHPPKWK